MKRVLLTGGTGFVGANLARRLLRDGHEVNLLLRRDYDPWRIAEIRHEVRIHEVELGDPAASMALLHRIAPDWIFHLAAHGAYSSQTDVQRIVHTNFVGTVNLIEACCRVGFEAFVNTGSSSEYGLQDHPPTEAERLEPNSHYAVSKAAATMYCRFTAQSRGLHMPTLRLYSVYGPYEAASRLMPTLILHTLEGRLPPLVNPEIARDFVYSEDVVDAYLRAATLRGSEPGAISNVGTGVQTTMRDLVARARCLFAVREEPAWGSMPDRGWDTTVWVADNRKISAQLGWTPRYSLEQGLVALAEWFQQHPHIRQLYRQMLAP